MKAPVVFMVCLCLLGCAGTLPSDNGHTGSETTNQADGKKEPAVSQSSGPVKSPHGYIITKDYEPGRFGGFVGDCADDQNWPFYWECQSENAGDGGYN
jgi:hypothetical protein